MPSLLTNSRRSSATVAFSQPKWEQCLPKLSILLFGASNKCPLQGVCQMHQQDSRPILPFKPEFSDLDYADVDYRSYGPINYKAASIALLQKQQRAQQQQQQQQSQERRPQMYGVADESEDLL
ncbi:hypothetical protein K0M31_000226 [Melipona bicolor]|uniref:Uncharacterized protein n=1 Tax=Melipona bicolor TaxID=60889 RepID=A0AA40GDV8_9HYME|nr:hypothetical protein K0M31_000226 [Melipona bicolor]